jgi:hypothetical protein
MKQRLGRLQGVLLGVSLLAAGVARAECQPSDACTDGYCRPIFVCGTEAPQPPLTVTRPGGVMTAAIAMPSGDRVRMREERRRELPAPLRLR